MRCGICSHRLVALVTHTYTDTDTQHMSACWARAAMLLDTYTTDLYTQHTECAAVFGGELFSNIGVRV